MDKIVAPNGVFVDDVFWFGVRIYYEDTDMGGIVYYANYLKYAERARTEFLRKLGMMQVSEVEDEKKGFIIRKASVEYIKSATLNDTLAVSCKVVAVKGASADIEQEIWRGDEMIAKVSVLAVYFDFDKKRPARIDPSIFENK